MKISTCECLSTFSKHSIRYLEDLVYRNKYEVSGKLILSKKTNTVFTKYQDLLNCGCVSRYFKDVYVVNVEDVKKGEDDSAEMIESRFNFHVHPEHAYKIYDCELGWPSKDDYITFLQTFLKYDTAYHCVISMEGIYVISVHPDMVKTIYSLKSGDSKKLFHYSIKKYINIDKTGYKKHIGYKMNNILINSGYTYEKAINTYKFPVDDKKILPEIRGKKLFKLAFISWSDLKDQNNVIGFCVTFPRINNTCEI